VAAALGVALVQQVAHIQVMVVVMAVVVDLFLKVVVVVVARADILAMVVLRALAMV